MNQAGYNARSLCTGTLVGPDRVLTAAHCVDPHRSDPIVFVAGWSRGEMAAERRVIKVTRGFEYDRRARPSLDMVAQDWAILHLEADIPNVVPLEMGRAPSGAPVNLLAYSASTPHALRNRPDCATRPIQAKPGVGLIMPIDCPADPGNSGGPVLVRHGDDWQVVGVISARVAGGPTLAVVPGAEVRAIRR